MKKEVARFAITHTQFVDENGNMNEDFPQDVPSSDILTQWYKTMVLTRVFDGKAINLQRTGKMGTYASSEGQEAVGVGLASAMQEGDVLVPTYREHVAQMMRADSPESAMTKILLFWGGDERGNMREGIGKDDFPACVPIGTQTCHAVGVAPAFKIRKEKRAVVCTVGDGGTSKGDFYESLNCAGAWQLPVVFVIVNNGFAISLSRDKQTNSLTLAQKGIAAGIHFCQQVDGNDVVAVYEAVRVALQRARAGQGPSVIEALTYRLSDHTTADDAKRYRSSEEVKVARKKDPLLRSRALLERLGHWDASLEEELQKQSHASVESAVKSYFDIIENHPQTASDMFVFLHEHIPESLVQQQGRALSEKKGGIGGH